MNKKLFLLSTLVILFLGCTTGALNPDKKYSIQEVEFREPTAEKNSIDLSHFKASTWEVLSEVELKKYKKLYVISDIHAEFEKVVALLESEDLIARKESSDWYSWKATAKQNLLVVVGDSIDKGQDGVGVIRLLWELKKTAAALGNRVVLVLGNHEAEYLSDPSDWSAELKESANYSDHSNWIQHSGPKVNSEELRASEFGKALDSMRVGAILGSWIVAHAGYFDVSSVSKASIHEYLEQVAENYQNRNKSIRLIDKDDDANAILLRHNWFRKREKIEKLYQVMNLLGADGIIFGHDPDGLSDFYTRNTVGRIVSGPEGRLIKVDVGMNAERGEKAAFMVCDLNKIFEESTQPRKSKLKLTLVKSDHCRQKSKTNSDTIPLPDVK